MDRDMMDLLLVQRDHSWEQEGWFPPLAAALEGVGPAEAAWRPPGGGNTIWQTVNHLNYYNERLLCRLTGMPFGPELDNDATFGEPGNPEDAVGWQAALERTRRIAQGLRTALAERGKADRNLALWVMHDAYHTGQIVLIRKQQGTWPARRG